MELYAKKYFQWNEPKEFLALRDDYEKAIRRWWTRPAAALTAGSAVASHWIHFSSLGALRSLGLMLLLILGTGIAIVYVIPYFYPQRASKVEFHKDYVLLNRGGDKRQVKYKDVVSFEWREREEFATLILNRQVGKRPVFIGVPKVEAGDEVSHFLMERHIKALHQEETGASAPESKAGGPQEIRRMVKG